MAQQARPNVHGQIADFRAQLTTFSTVVVRTGISPFKLLFETHRDSHRRPTAGARRQRRTPVEHALAPDVDVPGREDQREETIWM